MYVQSSKIVDGEKILVVKNVRRHLEKNLESKNFSFCIINTVYIYIGF